MAAILSTNFIGLLLVFSVVFNGTQIIHASTAEGGTMRTISFLAALACITDPITALVNSRPGAWFYRVGMISNSILFLCGTAAIWSWTIMMEHHLFGGLRRVRAVIIAVPNAVMTVLMFVNFFTPVIFRLDENNTYQRCGGYFLVVLAELGYVVYALYRYYQARKEGGILKFFPVRNFIIPLTAGIIVQTIFFGISVIPASSAVAYVSILVSLMNEKIYRDNLTGLYNRAYLDDILARLHKRHARPLAGVMIDLNGFKEINDGFGHLTGDEALIDAAGILNRAVGAQGSVIRYAGDEFILLLNLQDSVKIQECLARVKEETDHFNVVGGRPYQLSMACGTSMLNPETTSAEDFLNTIDHQMYEAKRQYYQETGRNRRQRR